MAWKLSEVGYILGFMVFPLSEHRLFFIFEYFLVSLVIGLCNLFHYAC